jgi:hypothetical protein
MEIHFLQHPLVHCTVAAIALTSALVIANWTRNPFTEKEKVASSNIGLCCDMKHGILHGGTCLGCFRDVSNDNRIDRYSIEQGDWNHVGCT